MCTRGRQLDQEKRNDEEREREREDDDTTYCTPGTMNRVSLQKEMGNDDDDEARGDKITSGV
jgi:hypothetical protein